jgi:parallel beta-helix repeat protein
MEEQKFGKIRRTLAILLAVCFLVSLTAMAVNAATLSVGPKGQYKTIQAAVTAATDRDTINVASGEYKEYVTLPDINVHIVGQKGKYPTVYGFAPNSSPMDIDGYTSIEGFTINNKGVSVTTGGSIVIKNNKFSNCGLSISGSSYNEITNNVFSKSKIGIFLSDTSEDSITGNIINQANTGLLVKGNATCREITRNTFKNCKVGVQIPSIPSYLIGNTYKNNKVNIKIA